MLGTDIELMRTKQPEVHAWLMQFRLAGAQE